ncbi:hypothetical protein CDL15_Pgr000398 [Punica granatum]|nr:hypothetical protein CDL15_Pgr000398 [Punica granatum]
MAPRKRLLRDAECDPKAEKAPARPPMTTTRVTRTSVRRALQAESVPEQPQKRKARKRGKAEAEDAGKDAQAEETAKGVTELTDEESAECEIDESKEAQPVTTAEEKKKKERTVVIEHCKQCNSFKTRALQVKIGLENGVSAITVLVNPDKPRRGCFEIREEGGDKFISLLGMKRPFTPMKKLDMEEVISEIIGKLNGD